MAKDVDKISPNIQGVGFVLTTFSARSSWISSTPAFDVIITRTAERGVSKPLGIRLWGSKKARNRPFEPLQYPTFRRVYEGLSIALDRPVEELQALMEMLIEAWKRQAGDGMRRFGYETTW